MLKIDQIDLSDLADRLDQRDYEAGYFDPETGAVYPVLDGEVVGLQEDGPVATYDVDLDGFIPLGGEGGHRVFRDMQLFADRVGERRTRRRLNDALDGPKPMRTFRSAVHSTPEMLGRKWNTFSDLRGQLRALDFLAGEKTKGEPLVAQDELDTRRAQLETDADAVLDDLGGGPSARLILLNGLPGVGKSTLAREYVATRPGTLNLDIDVLRTLLGGPWEDTAELGRSLALQVIAAHLESGHDVVVPQLVADSGQLRRFEDAAVDFDFVMVLVEGERRIGDNPWQQEVAPEELDFYRRKLDDLVSHRPRVERVQIVDSDLTVGLRELDELLRADAY